MRIYDKVKDLAKARNISIAELERRLELSNGSISKWNSYMPNTEPLLKVANFFGVSTDELLDNVDTSKEKSQGLLAAHIADDVTPEEMEEILDYINYIKSKR